MRAIETLTSFTRDIGNKVSLFYTEFVDSNGYSPSDERIARSILTSDEVTDEQREYFANHNLGLFGSDAQVVAYARAVASRTHMDLSKPPRFNANRH
jgi:hypothetical protein